MKKKLIAGVGVVACIVCGVLLANFLFSMRLYRWRKIAAGNVLIGKIETYRHQTGIYPKSLEDVGVSVTPEGPFFYEKLSDGRYQVWFGLELGESCTYDSKEKKWE